MDKLIARDKRLRRLYGITLADYNKMLDEQSGGCAICGRPPVKVQLSVDHDHKWKYLKIWVDQSALRPGSLLATVCMPPEQPIPVRYLHLAGFGPTVKLARAALKEKLKRASVRGLLCFSCNSGLRKFSDNSCRLANASTYLRKHQEVE
jgi:Recombination endonuclease VII